MSWYSTSTGANTYKSTQVQTASSGDLLLMLYDGAIRFLNKGVIAIAEKDWETAHNSIVKTEKIVTELMISLDLEKGGEIAENLHSLYFFMKLELVNGNIKKDVQPLLNVLELIKGLRDTWQTIVKKGTTDNKEVKDKNLLNPNNMSEKKVAVLG